MGASSSQNDGDIISSINVTPLVDITLVLLIIFMVTATYIVKAAIDVDLPQAQSGGESVGEMMTIVIKQAGAGDTKRSQACDVLALDGAVVQSGALIEALKGAYQRNHDTKVMISADKDCRHSEFVHIVDLVKQQGITKLAINIEQTDTQSDTQSDAP